MDARIDNTLISAADSVRSLGVLLDSGGMMTGELLFMSKSASYGLWRPGRS